ncbi:MAG: DNA topoisomerase 4 subunit A, partial [Candidatus Poseidoniaceae archaeon]|nr:DNA topoisomerase 4 subunit A [Candidatus Poseidoniaceae archaeon]
MTSEEEDNMEAEDDTSAPGGELLPRRLNEEMKTSYINYAMSVIIGRALPDARDGLKPVHRRVLYGMHEAGHTPEKSHSKSARSVGEVMGKFHPHGDQSIYDTMVRMAQEFSLRYPLIDGQGNFGSIDGDPPAAMRYTESRLDRIAKHMLEDIDKDTVLFQPNFDDSEMEPTVLPSRLPNLLLNGSDGIAVGMATRIPPHNLNEVADAIRLHVDRIIEEGEDSGDADELPNISIEEYTQKVTGPDFPTGATVYGIDGIYDMYSTGHGRFHIRSTCEVLDDSDGKKIIITEIPYQVKKAAMLEHIAELVTKEMVKGIRDIRDESSKEGIRVVIEVKNNADPHAVLNQLFKSSRLQESYSANMMGIIDGRPVLLTLPVMLHTHIRHRESVIERRTQFNLNKAEARAHILEGLVKAQDRIDDVIKVGRASSSREQFENVLKGDEKMSGISPFDFTEPQAKAIAERRLYQLSRLDVKKVQDEYDELMIVITDLKDILGSRRRRLDIMMEELSELVERHGDERRTHVDPMPLSMDREDLIAERAIVITLTNDNYIRHLPAEAFRMQNRGGKGMKGVSTKNEDFPTSLITCFSKDRLLIFTNRPATKMANDEEKPYIEGRVYGLKAWETPQGSRTSRGSHIRNILGLKDDETVVSIIPLNRSLVDDLESQEREHYLAFATRKGVIKKSKLSDYIKINRNGKKAINLAAEDELVAVRVGTDDHDVVLVSN